MTEHPDPNTFDLDAWLAGGIRPQSSVRVYGRADVMADLQRIEREVAIIEEAGEAAVGDTDLAALNAEYDALAAVLSESAIDIRVQNLDAATIAATVADVVGEADAKKSDRILTEAEQTEITLRQVQAAIVEPPMTLEQVRQLHSVIGDVQMLQVVRAWTTTGRRIAVKPPFSRKSSTRGDGDTA
jgi:hypothetical protein